MTYLPGDFDHNSIHHPAIANEADVRPDVACPLARDRVRSGSRGYCPVAKRIGDAALELWERLRRFDAWGRRGLTRTLCRRKGSASGGEPDGTLGAGTGRRAGSQSRRGRPAPNVRPDISRIPSVPARIRVRRLRAGP